jgi:nitrogen regulatory protein PII
VTHIKYLFQIARTGQGEHGDGIIFVSTVDQAIKIATSEKGEKVIL